MTEASYMINSLQSALASAERTFQLLDEEEERPDPAHARRPWSRPRARWPLSTCASAMTRTSR